jgi:aspartate racemase
MNQELYLVHHDDQSKSTIGSPRIYSWEDVTNILIHGNTMKTIGVLGGMGPVATGEFFNRMLALCQKEHNAFQDGDYPPILVYSMSLKGSNESGIKDEKKLEFEFIDGIIKLCNGGCDFVVIPCNTAHHFVEDLRKKVDTPILSIIDLAVAEVKKNKIKKIGLLASESTYIHKVYAIPLSVNGIELVSPEQNERKKLTKIVLDIMGGKRTEEDRKTIKAITDRMVKDNGIEAVIVGCTELSLVLPNDQYPVKAFDAMDSLAEAAVKTAYK